MAMNERKYKKQQNERKAALIVEILLTVCMAVIVVMIGLSNLSHEAGQFAEDIQSDYRDLCSGYITTFRMMEGQIQEKIQEDVSFEEMDQWLKSMDNIFREQIGADVYDGISMTYQGGYAHSWDYGDYSNYDPDTRPWYRQAQKANGEIAVVAPYVTYLDPSYLSDDEYILMTIARKYSDDISFDYDLKIGGIRQMLVNRSLRYEGTQVLFYDRAGYILSSSEEAQFAHNISVTDDVISNALRECAAGSNRCREHLAFSVVDGGWKLTYSSQDMEGNTLCILYPCWLVIFKNFLMPILAAVLLLMFELCMYRQNKKTILEFKSRDERLSEISDAAFAEQLYVDLDTMKFSGNKKAQETMPGGSYPELFPYLCAMVQDEMENREFVNFLSPEALLRAKDSEVKLQTRRFPAALRDGEKELVLEISRMISLVDGKLVASILANDVTEDATVLKEALQQAEQASRAKGEFMSRISHEIRTPLNAVIGYLEITQDEYKNPQKVMHCLEKSQVASRHLLSIINDVLDISSIDSGRMKLAHEDFDLKQMVHALTTLFYAQAKAKGVEFEVHVEALETEWISGDELRVRQTLLNLLSNAVKFTAAGGSISLNIKQVHPGQDKIHLQFEVCDTGIGMSPEYMKRIFTPFEQENSSITRQYGGTGLGLSISNNLIHMMGGHLHVESEQGKGSTFTVMLAFDPAKTQQQDHLATESFTNVRALAVDDEADTCEYVKKLMSRCGVKCDTVTSGKKALRRIKSRMESDHPYDLCIIDWNMKDMDGLETAKEMREICGADLPIIIATAYDYSSIVDQSKTVGVDKIVSKPLFQSTLFNILVNFYGKYEPAAPQKKREVNFRGMHLILAEDNEMNMEIALDILRKAGLTITPVENGQQALETFIASAPGTFDAILMDVQMPIMDGYEATRAIRRSEHPQAKSIPIVAMTANAFAEDVTAALAAGMNDHVAKPVSYDRLFDVLSELTVSPYREKSL